MEAWNFAMKNEKEVDRRNFMRIATLAIGGLLSAAYALPAIAYLIEPAVRIAEAQNWIRIGSTSKVETGVPTLFKTTIERKTGWITNEEEVSVYLTTPNGRDFVALSNICTHLGCRVRWIDDEGKFFCPCHNAIFDKDGNVVTGPPPLPLEQFETKIEDDQIFILVS